MIGVAALGGRGIVLFIDERLAAESEVFSGFIVAARFFLNLIGRFFCGKRYGDTAA